jgi:hypothetical protein
VLHQANLSNLRYKQILMTGLFNPLLGFLPNLAGNDSYNFQTSANRNKYIHRYVGPGGRSWRH